MSDHYHHFEKQYRFSDMFFLLLLFNNKHTGWFSTLKNEALALTREFPVCFFHWSSPTSLSGLYILLSAAPI